MIIHDVCDYIIFKLNHAEESLSHLKLQKLLYYVQAWHLAFHHRPLFDGKFQAWVHGPVSKEIYERFNINKSLYSDILQSDIRQEFNVNALLKTDKLHIDSVLDVYAKFSGSQLEEMYHDEDPWINARKGYSSSQRCEVEIDEALMAQYYAARLADSDD